MTKDEIKDKVISILGTLGCDTSITMEFSLEGDLQYDDLDKIESQFYLEDEFRISIPDDKWDEVKTVGDAVNLVTEILEQQ